MSNDEAEQARVTGHGFQLGEGKYHLLPNTLIHDSQDGAKYRILYIEDMDGRASGYWIDIAGKSNIPVLFREEDILEGLASGRYENLVDTSLLGSVDEATLSAAQKRVRDEAFDAIKDIVGSEPDIYDAKKRTGLLKKAEEKSGVKLNNLYRYLGKYWKGGKQRNALIPDFKNCGGHRTAASTQNTRQGRPKREGANGKILTEEDYQKFEKAIHTYYEKSSKTSLVQAYRDMIDFLYVRPKSKDDPSPVSLLPDEKPSLQQFRYWYKKNVDKVSSTKEKEGENKFALNHRAVTGKSETFLRGPGITVQIDATIGDVYLVRKNSREQIIGRPVLFFIKDVYSHMIVGMNITLDNASWNQALLAIKNTADDKVEFCRRYGVHITPEQWPCHHLPSSITGDNGEMGDKGVEEIIAKLGITIENTPPYRGDLKGIIEKNFDLIHLKLQPITPGYVCKDAGTRGAEDYRKKACLDYKTFVSIVIRIVLFYNNYHYMETYEKTLAMREHGVRPIPLELWNYGMRYESGLLRAVSREDILKVLLPHDKARVTEEGICFKQLYYTCREAEESFWFEQTRIEGVRTVLISYDPGSVDHIYIHAENGHLITCSLLARSAGYSTVTPEEMDGWKEDDANEKAAYNQTEEQARAELSHKLKETIDACLKEKASASEIKAALNRGSIQTNRDEEKREINGEKEALEEQERLGIGSIPSKDGPTHQVEGNDTNDTNDANDAKAKIDKVIDAMMHEEGLD